MPNPAMAQPAQFAAAAPVLPYAGFWLRFVAYLIDMAIVDVVLFGIVILGVVTFGGMTFLRGMQSGMNSNDPAAVATFVALIIVAALAAMGGMWVYYAWMESSQYQGTVGKMALGLTVTDLDARRVTFGRATGRFFAKIVTGLIPLAIGYIMAGFTQKKQALHDMIASCLVLKKI
jgi:uncharacterized RDD family membrane protein YckC